MEFVFYEEKYNRNKSYYDMAHLESNVNIIQASILPHILKFT